MSHPVDLDRRSERAMEALLRLREAQDKDARMKLRLKQAEILRLQEEIADLRKRRETVIRRGGAHVIRERMLLDALLRSALEKKREVEALRVEAGTLVEGYREAKARRDVVVGHQRRRRLEKDLALERQADIATGDTGSARKAVERRMEEEPWES